MEEECIIVEEVEGFKQNNLSSENVFANANKNCNSLSSVFLADPFSHSFCNLMRLLTIVIVGADWTPITPGPTDCLICN